MRRKHKRRYTVIALLLLLGVSGAAALAMLPGGYGSGNYGNFAFSPEQLLSVFKKADTPIGGQPQTPRTYAAYQPGEIPEINELPIDEPLTEFVDGDDVQEAGLAPDGGTTNIPKGGPGQPPQNNGQPNVGDDGGGAGGAGGGGGGAGGGGGGTSANRMMASLVTTPEEKACEGEACVAECTGEDCVAECTGEDCIAKCEGEDCIAKCEGADCVAQCEGTDCTTQCEGTDCTTENNGNTETADDSPNPGTCTGPNCDDEQLAGCVAGETCEPVCDELTSLSDTACIYPKEDSIPTASESTVAVDEPGPLSLLLISALGLALARRRAKRNAKSRSDV